MLGFLRHGFAIVVALIVGYSLGNGPFAEWMTDIAHQLGIAWTSERASRGPGGTLPLLVAGFLLGQGLFLLARGIAKRIEPWRARHTERMASWDSSLKLGTRFGLFQYLEQCSAWAAEDPTTRTQTLALFKIYGLGSLNEVQGTLGTTKMLQDIATELRSASLPDNVSGVTRWRMVHFPRPRSPSVNGVPVARYAGRWSGATFALAFRELDAVQAVAIARDFAHWLTRELESVATESSPLRLAAVAAVGSPGATGRALGRIAASKLSETAGVKLKVLCDPADVRAPVISQMSDVQHEQASFEQRAEAQLSGKPEAGGLSSWLRSWGPSLGCLFGAIVLMALTGSGAPATITIFPWPESLTEIQVVDAKGPRAIHLLRTRLPDNQSSDWRLSDVVLVQGDPKDGTYPQCHIHLTVTNTSKHTYFVSTFDFTAVDESGAAISFDPARTVRTAGGLTGLWLAPGKSWSGWLVALRKAAPVVALRFEPDRATRLYLKQTPGIAAPSE